MQSPTSHDLNQVQMQFLLIWKQMNKLYKHIPHPHPIFYGETGIL